MHIFTLIQSALFVMANIMPYLAIIISFAGVYFSGKSFKRLSKNDKEELANKMATKDFVLKEVKTMSREFELQLEIQAQAQEETRSLIEKMSEQVQFIFEKHFKG